jgi:large subunit ribosomal protein L13
VRLGTVTRKRRDLHVTTRTYSPRPRDIERRWYVVDADGAVLGRLASEVAKILRGKHKPIFAPHMDTGDHVIVVNAKGIRLTGGKDQSKVYWRHSGYPGGIRGIGYASLLADRPALAVERAVKGMLPKNRLGRAMFKKLSVYEGPDHPHRAQQPVPLVVGETPKWEGLPAPAPVLAPAPKKAQASGRSARDTARTPRPRKAAFAAEPSAPGKRTRGSGVATEQKATMVAAETEKRPRRATRKSKET